MTGHPGDDAGGKHGFENPMFAELVKHFGVSQTVIRPEVTTGPRCDAFALLWAGIYFSEQRDH